MPILYVSSMSWQVQKQLVGFGCQLNPLNARDSAFESGQSRVCDVHISRRIPEQFRRNNAGDGTVWLRPPLDTLRWNGIPLFFQPFPIPAPQMSFTQSMKVPVDVPSLLPWVISQTRW